MLLTPIESLEGRLLLSATATQTFTINSALSYATGSGSFTVPIKTDSAGNPVGPMQRVAIKQQFAGSLTNHASGTITVATTASTVQFVKAAIKAGSTGSANPGKTPANFAGMLSYNGTEWQASGIGDNLPRRSRPDSQPHLRETSRSRTGGSRIREKLLAFQVGRWVCTLS